MTDYNRIKEYYQTFDEEKRLENDASGRLEFEMTMRILEKHLPATATILDLGAAAGAYTFPLSERGYKMYLADLSEDLVAKAREKIHKTDNKNIVACDTVNAVDLGIYGDKQFDAVLLMGPLYHLLEENERNQCVKEVSRVLKNGGLVFAAFIPRLAGGIALIDRYFLHPEQVNADNFKETFATGKFTNAVRHGFQEGYYANSRETEALFSMHGFTKITVSSIRGFGYGKEELLYNIKDETMLREIMDLMEKTSSQPAIVETCGHAMYVGYKKTL